MKKNKKNRNQFGNIIKRLRLDKKLSQEKLAELADIHRTYISSIELGKVDISFEIGFKLSKALDVPLHKIIKEIENKR